MDQSVDNSRFLSIGIETTEGLKEDYIGFWISVAQDLNLRLETRDHLNNRYEVYNPSGTRVVCLISPTVWGLVSRGKILQDLDKSDLVCDYVIDYGCWDGKIFKEFKKYFRFYQVEEGSDPGLKKTRGIVNLIMHEKGWAR